MTAEEAAALKPGDRVMVEIGGRWVVVVVERVYPPDEDRIRWRGKLMIRARRPGLTSSGSRHSRVDRPPSRIQRTGHLDPVTANVYADWLAEVGEHRAAHLLREAFPREDGKKEVA